MWKFYKSNLNIQTIYIYQVSCVYLLHIQLDRIHTGFFKQSKPTYYNLIGQTPYRTVEEML